MPRRINILVGGEAGQGVQSVGALLTRAFARSGYHVFADQDYESRIRGGHSFFRVRAATTPVGAISESVDILIAFNKETVDLHKGELAKDGTVICDVEKSPGAQAESLIDLPMEKLAVDSGGDKVMANTVALAGALALLNYDADLFAGLLRDHFKGETGEKNVRVAEAGYAHIRKMAPADRRRKLAAARPVKRMVISGTEAMALGAIAAGCKFMAAYPMTPVTGIMEYFVSKQNEMGLVMVPAEDEIAAVHMAIGASFAGVRAMTASSGGGFALMVEGLGLAGITETPIVIVEGQRPGPGIGLPTRTEQGDLDFVMHSPHGDFPRVVLTPATIEDCFWEMPRAFNMADRYQTPVIVMTDHHLASSYATVEPFDVSKISIDRGLLYTEGRDGDYKRYADTDSGISPRAFPGKTKALVVADSDEHDEAGHLTEDAGVRALQVRKRLRKLYSARKEMLPPRLHGPKKTDTLLIGWGSTFGAMKEAVDLLRKEGRRVNLLHIHELWPFPADEVTDRVNNAQRTYVVENNAVGQLARLIRRETGKQPDATILKYDGRPFTPSLVAAEVKKEGC